MELRQIRSVLALAETRHFTRAAEQLSIAQPALSQQIKALEEELSVRLFERSSRRVQLTDAGMTFVAEARRILDGVERLRTMMHEYAGLVRGRVLVGTVQLFSETSLPRLLGGFHREYPGIDITLREDITHGILSELRAGSLDVAFANISAPQEHPDLAITVIGHDEVALAMAPSHPLAKRSSVRFDEVREETFVVYAAGSRLHEQLMENAQAAGFTPRIAFESSDPWTLRALAAEGLGMTLLPRQFLASPGSPIVAVSLDPPIFRSVAMAHRQTTAPTRAAQAFIDFIRASFSTNQQERDASRVAEMQRGAGI